MKKLKTNHCTLWGLPTTPQDTIFEEWIFTFFRVSCSGSDAYMRVSKNCFDRLSPIAYTF